MTTINALILLFACAYWLYVAYETYSILVEHKPEANRFKVLAVSLYWPIGVATMLLSRWFKR
jgi:hypothetical protein